MKVRAGAYLTGVHDFADDYKRHVSAVDRPVLHSHRGANAGHPRGKACGRKLPVAASEHDLKIVVADWLEVLAPIARLAAMAD